MLEAEEQMRQYLRNKTLQWLHEQIANQLPKASWNLSDVQQALKDLLSEGLVQVNSVVFGLYRLTTDGKTTKELELSENQ